MVLAVDIGNSAIHLGLFRQGGLHGTFSLATAPQKTGDEYRWMLRSFLEENGVLPEEIEGGILGSVVPALTERMKTALEGLLSVAPLVVGPGIRTGFPIRLDDPTQLGADLAANTAAVLQRVGAPAIWADFGTVTVMCAVDANRACVGVSILPGVGMSLDAMHLLSLLPTVSASGETPVLGKNTPDAMRSGTVRGIAMAAEGFARLYRDTLAMPEDTPFVVSGGMAEAVLPYLPKEAAHLPHMTLWGLLAIYEHHRKKAET